MLPDTGIDDVKKQRNAEYAIHINDPVLSSLKMEGIRLLFMFFYQRSLMEAINMPNRLMAASYQISKVNTLIVKCPPRFAFFSKSLI
jgi:hypothetical protein